MDIDSLYSKYLLSRKVCTDTRQIAAGALFFALKGPKYNANAFAEEALGKGAGYAVVDEEKYATGERVVLVEDSLKALQDLARHHRTHLKIPVIGLTGSNGKTTTKDLISAVLSKKYKTLATSGNLNNHIGVPLTVLAIDTATEIAIVEMGANHVGEIALLCGIADPTHGLITNIGKAHIGTFGGMENIIRGKSELFQHLITRKGRVFINSSNPVLAAMAKRFAEPVLYPAKGDYYHCELTSVDPFIKLKTENGSIVETHLIGDYNFENVASALCVGKHFGVDASDANGAVADYVPGAMRSQLVKKGTNLIVLDAYNANPSSMEAAIKNLAKMNSSRKIAILGDMYELEEESEAEHRNLGNLLRDQGLTEVYLCGPLIQKALETFPQAHYFPSKEALADYLSSQKILNATILVKASRGMALETVVEVLK